MKCKKLIDCCEFISDGDHLPPPKSRDGIPFITISNITGQNKISFEDTMFVPKSYYDKLSETKIARKGDILYSVVGSFGKPVYVDFKRAIVFQRHIAILRPKSEVNGKYLYYTMLNPQFYRMVDKLHRESILLLSSEKRTFLNRSYYGSRDVFFGCLGVSKGQCNETEILLRLI